MKLLSILITLCVFLGCISNDKGPEIALKVIAHHYEGDTLEIFKLSFTDSFANKTIIRRSSNGTFEYSDSIQGSDAVHIFAGDKISDVIFLEEGQNIVEVYFNELNTHASAQFYKTHINNPSNRLFRIYDSLTNLSPENTHRIIDSLQVKYFDSYFIPYILLENRIYNWNDYYSLSDNVKSSKFGLELKSKLEANENLNVEDYRFEVTDINGNIVAPMESMGEHVLLNFWASYCAPCIKKFKDLKRLNSKYQDLKIVLISIDQHRELLWRELIEKHELEEWANILANSENQISSQFQIEILPTYFLKNGSSLDRYTDLSIESLDNLLNCQINSKCN